MEERWNNQPVALLGGIAIFASYTFSLLVVLPPTQEWMVLCSGGLVVFVVGLIDDLSGLSAGAKLAGQGAVAFGLTRCGIISHVTQNGWLDVPFTVLWIIGVTNALNLLDNMDGLACGAAIAASIGLWGLSLFHGQAGVALMCLALAGSCAGFLKYNFQPATIHMGDCGSLFLGYTLAVLAIMAGWRHGRAATPGMLAPCLILGVALFDTTLVCVLRLANHRKPWRGGRDHSSHRLVSVFNNNERHAVLALYGIGILCSGLGMVLAIVAPVYGILLIACFCAAMTALGVMLARIPCYQSAGERVAMSPMDPSSRKEAGQTRCNLD